MNRLGGFSGRSSRLDWWVSATNIALAYVANNVLAFLLAMAGILDRAVYPQLELLAFAPFIVFLIWGGGAVSTRRLREICPNILIGWLAILSSWLAAYLAYTQDEYFSLTRPAEVMLTGIEILLVSWPAFWLGSFPARGSNLVRT